MASFAGWLNRLPPNQDADLQALKGFVAGNASDWPDSSADIGDYISVVAIKATDATRNALLVTLGRYFIKWQVASQSGANGFWARIAAAGGGRIGGTLLALFGLVVAAILTRGIFYGDFLNSMAKPEQARGLITFLFSFTTIAVFLLIAITTFWMDKTQVEVRFGKAKDLLTLMIGIFGTILGFYYGSLAAPSGPTRLSLADVGVPSIVLPADGKTTISATVQGGTGPLTYDLYFSDPTGSINADGLTVKDRPVRNGAISEPVTISANPTKPASVTYTLVVHDTSKNQTQALGTLIVPPKGP